MARAKRSLGQNFLVDSAVIERILRASGVTKGDLVMEIGPGRGALTLGLVARARRFVAIEKDDDLAALITRHLEPWPTATLMHTDALFLTPDMLPEPGPWKLVANLPYNIAGRLIIDMLAWGPEHLSTLTVMLQREVALRFCAGPGSRDYGVVSILASTRAEAWHLFGVLPASFRPRPKVQSSIVRLRLREQPLVSQEHYERVRRTARAAFSSRRKTMLNSLTGSLAGERSREAIVAALESVGLDPEQRAERVPPAGYIELAAALFPEDGESSEVS